MIAAGLLLLSCGPALAQQDGKLDWLGITWTYAPFDNGHGLAGYVLISDNLNFGGGGGCNAQAEALFSRLEAQEGAVYLPPPLVLRTNHTRSYRLKGRVDLEATVIYENGGCGAQITVLNPIELPG